jgi:hypothetical protein
MDTTDEIPLEDHRYFRARLDHLESHHSAALLSHLERGTLTEHLRDVTARAMQAKANLVFNQKLPEDQANEMVMRQLIADPEEFSRIDDPMDRLKLRLLLEPYKEALSSLRRTYLSESETTE